MSDLKATTYGEGTSDLKAPTYGEGDVGLEGGLPAANLNGVTKFYITFLSRNMEILLPKTDKSGELKLKTRFYLVKLIKTYHFSY